MAKAKVPEEDPVVQDVDDEEDSDDDSSDDGPPDLEDGDASGRGKQSKMEKKSRSGSSLLRPTKQLPFVTCCGTILSHTFRISRAWRAGDRLIH